MFGGLLLSSGSMCKTKTVPENKYKRKFEQQYGRRIIRFHNVPEKIAQEPCPVLQQENNDIVDAVKKEYQDLPQYQPVSGLVSNIAGLHGETCAVNISRPSVIDRGVSPMHSPRNENTLDYENSSHKDGENVGLENDEKGRSKKLSITLHNKYSVGEDDYTQRIPTASSGIGTISPESFEIDSLEDFPISENDTQPLNETTTLQSNGSGFPVDKTRPTFERKIDRGVYGGGRLSVLQLECAPSCLCVNGFNCSIHGTKADKTEALSDGRRITNERLTWGDIAPNTNTGDPTLGSQGNIDNKCSDILRFCTPPADVSGPLTTKNIQERNQSPLRRADLEKWLNDVEEFRRKGKEPYNATLLESSDAETENHRKDYSLTRAKKSLISGHRKMRAPLQESLQLLKRLQLNSENDLQVARTKSPIHRGGRGSCLKTVRAPSSLCLCGGTCNAHCQVEVTSDQSFAPVADSFGNSIKHESTDTLRNERQCSSLKIDRIAKGGRQSTLNHVRAPSEICIHGPSCQFHCQKIQKAAQQNEKGETCARKYQELHPPEIHAELDELRGASSFGEVQGRYKTLQDQSYGHSTVQDNDFRKEECNDNNLRGASSFGDSRLAIPQQIVTSVENIRGASSFAQGPANDNETDFNEMRGASCFAPLDESIAGTTSVTLSFAVESDGESFLANTFSNKKGSVSTLNLRKCVDKLRDKTRVSKEKVKQDLQTDFLISTDFCKEKFVIDPNNNSSANHAREQINNHASDRRIERKKLDARGGITTTEKIDERKETSKGFGGRILKVGKDVNYDEYIVTCASERWRTKTNRNFKSQNYSTHSQKKYKQLQQKFSWESEIFSFLQRSQFSKAFALRQRAGSPRSIR